METLKDTKELTLIEKARQAIQTFPEKLTKNQQELKELVDDWDNTRDYNLKAREHNDKLLDELEEYKPIFKEVEKMSWDFRGIARKILNPKIKEAWETEKTHSDFSSYNKCYELTEKLKKIEKFCEQWNHEVALLKELFTRKWQKSIYYSNDILKIEKQIETRLNRENKK